MRYVSLSHIERQKVFDILLDTVADAGYSTLYADRFHLEIEAMSEGKLTRRKHVSLRVKELSKGKLDVSIEVRNLGLELKRSKQNLIKEAHIERELLKRVRAVAKNSSAA